MAEKILRDLTANITARRYNNCGIRCVDGLTF